MMSLRHKVSMVLIQMNIASNTGLSGVVDLHNAVSKHNKIISMHQMLSYNLPQSIFGLPNVASRGGSSTARQRCLNPFLNALAQEILCSIDTW